MAISLIGNPPAFSPGYNPLYYYFDSSNKNEAGFRYIVDVYQKTGPSSQTLIKRLRIPPAITTGYCHAEISKTLQSFLTSQLPTVNSAINPTDSYLRFNLEIGEEFQVAWEYDDYEFYSSSPSDPFNAYCKLVSNTSPQQAHTFQVGDQINVAQNDGGTTKPMLQGLQTVVAVPDQYTVVIGIGFDIVGSGPTIGGSVTYFDNRKTIFSNLYTISDNCVWNGSINHFDFPNYTISTFGLSTSSPGPALTNLPDEFTLTQDASLVINWFNNYSTNLTYIYFENDLGTVRRASVVNTSVPMLGIGVGPSNMIATSLVSGSGAIIEDDVTWYRFWTANGSGTRTSQYYRINLDRSITNYTKYELAFLDRLGSITDFSFIYDTQINGTIERKDQKFLLGGLSGGKWTYSSTDTGSRVLNVDFNTKYVLNTAWLTQEESDYFAELLTSPRCWIKINNQWWPCIIEDSQWERRSLKTQNNLRYSITVRLANAENLINW